MENLVPLGTGNSRSMKSNISPNTTLAQLIQMLNNGTFPYDVGPINPAGISQQGTPLNKDTLLADLVAQKLGGAETPSEAFDLLRQLQLNGKYAFRVKATQSDGTPVVGFPIIGLLDFSGGGYAVTGSDGVAVGYTTSASGSFTTGSYTDLSSTTVSAQGDMGAIVESPTIIVTFIDFARFTASATVRFSPAMTRLDVSLCGAGSGGGSGGGIRRAGGNGGGTNGGSGGDNNGSNSGGGGGGQGGGVLVQTNVPFESDHDYEVVVPAGGAGGAEKYNLAEVGNDGTAGGLCTAFGLSSPISGRSGSSGKKPSSGGGDGGKGGDAGTSGNNQIFSSFTAMKNCGVGGAFGAGGEASSTGTRNYGDPGRTGTAPGGGGGGGGGVYDDDGSYRSGAGGDGARGEAAIRMWHGEEAS